MKLKQKGRNCLMFAQPKGGKEKIYSKGTKRQKIITIIVIIIIIQYKTIQKRRDEGTQPCEWKDDHFATAQVCVRIFVERVQCVTCISLSNSQHAREVDERSSPAQWRYP